jgi:hypothetical protein
LLSFLTPVVGGVVDLVSGSFQSASFNTPPPQVIGLDALGRQTVGRGNPTGTGGLIWTGPGRVLAPAVYTRIVVARISTGGPGYGGVFTISSTDGSIAFWAIQDESDGVRMSLWHGSTYCGVADTWANVANDRYQCFVMRSNNATSMSWWRNGISASDVETGSAPYAPDAISRAVFGGARDASSSYAWPCAIAAVGTLGTLLSDAECAAISRDWRLCMRAEEIWIPHGYTHPTLSNARMGSLTSTGGVPQVTFTRG